MHNVILCSDWSKGMYPNNTGAKFTYLLHSNLNFSREDWSGAVTDVIYTPDTWTNVREGFNDIQIRMKGFQKRGLAPCTLWGTRSPIYEVVGSKCTVTVTRDVGEECREQIISYKSEQMPINTPVFKDQDAALAIFAPTLWSKDVCNKYHLDIVYNESPYTLWCTAPPTYEVIGSECTVTIGRRGMTAGKCRNYGLSYFKS